MRRINDIALTYWYGIKNMPDERTDKIVNNGFSKVSLHWCDEYKKANGDKHLILKKCKEKGISIIAFHLSFEKADNLWINNLQGRRLYNIYKRSINEAYKNGVKIVVMHLNSDGRVIKKKDLGLKRLEKLLNYARTKDVTIAFENLQKYDAIDLIEDLLKHPNAGICFDIGHSNILPFAFEKYFEKIRIVHIHDNNGINDSHKVPYQGTLNWDKTFTFFSKLGKEVVMVLEVQINNTENEETFLKDVYKCSLKLKQEIFSNKERIK